MNQCMRSTVHRRLLERFGIARQGCQDSLFMGADEKSGAAKALGAIEAQLPSGELLHDARDARVSVLDVIHRILAGPGLGELEIEIEWLIVAAHEIEESTGIIADLLAQLAQRDELGLPLAHRDFLTA